MIAGAPGKPAVLSRTVWDRPRYALRDERYKFVYDTRTGEEWLYDLEADPGETRDLGPGRAAARGLLSPGAPRLDAEAGPPAARPAPSRPSSPASSARTSKALGYVQSECR